MVSTLPSHFDATVVGVSFAPGYPSSIQDLNTRPGASLVVEWDRDNPSSNHAVAVIDERGGRVGYLPDKLAQRVQQDLEEGATWAVVGFELHTNDKHQDRPGLSISLVRGTTINASL